MAAFIEYFSTVAGRVPTPTVTPPTGPVVTTMVPGSLAVNVPDQTIYTMAPDGSVIPVSQYSANGITPVDNDFDLHPQTFLSNVCQFGVGLTQAQLSTLITVGASGLTTSNAIPVFALGIQMWIPPLSSPVSSVGAYLLTITLGVTNEATITPLTATQANSGSLSVAAQQVSMVIYSDGQTYPWFYLSDGLISSTADPETTSLYRISPFKTFGAIPVSAGPAAQPATSYWGTYP